MPIHQRGQSYQVAFSHKGKRYRAQFQTHAEAHQWELASQLAIAEGREPVVPSKAGSGGAGGEVPTTYGELTDYLVRHHWRGTRGEKSATINAKHMARIIGEGTKLRSVTTHTINLAVEQLRNEGYPDSTINKKLSATRVKLTYAEKERWIARMPQIPFFQEGEGRERVFSKDEERDQTDWCKAHGFWDLLDYIVVSYDTGMRQGEVLELRPHNLDGDVLVLRGAASERDRGTKARNTRRVPMTDRVLAILTRRSAEGGKLFEGYDKDTLRREWDRMRKALGGMEDPEYVPHAMRHSFCSRLVNDHNISLTIVQKLAGHRRIETTAKYVHEHADALGRAISALAPRKNSVYTPTPNEAGVAPHDNVACHISGVDDSIGADTQPNVLNFNRK